MSNAEIETRGLGADGTIHTELREDMYSLPDETYIEAEVLVDGETGEVLENP